MKSEELKDKIANILFGIRAEESQKTYLGNRSTFRENAELSKKSADKILSLIEAPAERWETVEQWEKRTGKVYPDDGPVWYSVAPEIPETWHICECWMVKKTDIKTIYIADHHGKPPAEGKGEEV